MGAQISGAGTDKLLVDGVARLHGASHPIVADRIETGTYACAAAITGGEVRLLGGRLTHLGAFARAMGEAGVEVRDDPGEDGAALLVRRLNGCTGPTP